MKQSIQQLFRLRLAAYILSLVAGFGMLASNPAQADEPAPEEATSKFEIMFMEDMIDHHAMAVQMSQLCLAKAVHQELRALCDTIIADQQKEIAMMQSWLSTWYGISNYQPKMNEGDQQQMQKLSMLNNSDFEIHFMQQMIRHHKTAVVRGAQCLQRAYHDELEEMCEEMIVSQVAEIRKMKHWLCVWYGICTTNRRHHDQ